MFLLRYREIRTNLSNYTFSKTILVVMQVIMGPVMEVVGIAMVQLVRYNEFGADRFAAELGRADHLESALAKLFKV